MTTPNVELLRQTMDEILAHPEKHDQRNWAKRTGCGTAYCFAGMACHISGLEADFITIHDAPQEMTGRLDNGGFIPDEAERLLGLDHDTAFRLFNKHNTTADLKHYVDEIAEHGRIIETVR